MIDQNYQQILTIFAKGHYKELIDLCAEALGATDVSFDSSINNLKKGLLRVQTIPLESFDLIDMLALLYFTYFIGKTQNS